MSLSCHFQRGHGQGFLCGGFKRESESCHVSLLINFIDKTIRTRAVFCELSGKALGAFAVYSEFSKC